jgi:hypothetical protein
MHRNIQEIKTWLQMQLHYVNIVKTIHFNIAIAVKGTRIG